MIPDRYLCWINKLPEAPSTGTQCGSSLLCVEVSDDEPSPWHRCESGFCNSSSKYDCRISDVDILSSPTIIKESNENCRWQGPIDTH
mmetsp:Transcript_114132/g.207588  ORF Transcript_114132/g.207588 Transcript_114132/m.207588 type:complete len:87 (+) Transcript_114132:1438-1698(+)